MNTEAGILEVVEAIYDAAMDESRWPIALEKLTRLTDSQAASFWVLDGSAQPRLPVFTSINFEQNFIAEYLKCMVPHDPTVQYLVSHPHQPIVHDGLFITEREKDRHPYYDWHGRHSDTRFRLVNQMCPAPAVQAGVALHRARRVGRYEAHDIEQFEVLHRHIERALAIGFRIGSLGTLQRCTIDLLERNPAAIVLLDEHRRVVYANRAAGSLHEQRDGVVLAATLSLLRKPDNDRLQRLLAESSALTESPHAPSAGVMRALRPSGKRPYAVLVTPMPRRYPALSTLRPAICVIITDPEAQTSLSGSRLKAVFGLTDAETQLALRLATGEDLQATAAKLRIRYGTARTRLVEIFRKTETHRQGELIRLLLTTLAMG
ncbi:MAG TPA: hypothetical protein VGA88_05100 [Burkholderiales bacterium]